MAISLTGMILKGRYCILEQIGKGGEGSLYLARDLELGTLWAVKVIPVCQKKEAKLLRLLEHPSLPKMVDYLEKEEFCYLVMEYVKGKSLGQWLREGRCFSSKEIAVLGKEAAQVLAYLHSQKPPVYYGDLKPDNLMLSGAGRLYLVDFGSAVFGYSSRQRVCQGTKGYAAPEQYEGRIGKQSDVYALGKTLLALLEGNRRNLWMKSPGLFLIAGKCCRKKEKRRFQDMKAVEKALDGKLRGQGRSRRYVLTVSVFTALFLAGAGIAFPTRKTQKFSAALTETTGLYYEEMFQNGSLEQQKGICERVEKALQKMIKVYQKKEEQRRILLLLAVNGEYQGEIARAALYYEQLLLYDNGFREAYGEYGMFLWRLGQEEESFRLWEDYQEKEENGLLEAGGSRTLELWEACMDEWTDEKRSALADHDTGNGGSDSVSRGTGRL